MSEENPEEKVVAPDPDETVYPTLIGIGDTEYSSADYPTPTDRAFREAWEQVDTAISVNMSQARDIWRDKIRKARVSVFAGLDADFMKALEAGADTSAIVTQKQALRDAPAHPDIDAATTPEQLKNVQPITGVTIK